MFLSEFENIAQAKKSPREFAKHSRQHEPPVAKARALAIDMGEDRKISFLYHPE